MKKVFSTVFALALIMILAACGSAEPEVVVVPSERSAAAVMAEPTEVPAETPEASTGPVHDPKAGEGELVSGLVGDFAQAYFFGTAEDVRPYLSAGFSEAVESYSMLESAEPNGIEIQYLSPLENDPDRYAASVRFVRGDEDSYTYLAIDLVKEDGGWYVDFYGLQK